MDVVLDRKRYALERRSRRAAGQPRVARLCGGARAGLVQRHEAVELRIKLADTLQAAVEERLGVQGAAAKAGGNFANLFFHRLPVSRFAEAARSRPAVS